MQDAWTNWEAFNDSTRIEHFSAAAIEARVSEALDRIMARQQAAEAERQEETPQ